MTPTPMLATNKTRATHQTGLMGTTVAALVTPVSERGGWAG
jgi:hypothetical protein